MLKEIVEELQSVGFEYNKEHESKMFNDRIVSFYNSKDIEAKIMCLIDCMYVKLGTMCKLAYNGFDADDLPYSHKTTIDMMTNIVQTELGDNYMRVIKEAERIVCECNAGKGTKLKNGKVAKDAKVRNATEEIANLLEAISTETIEVED